MRNFFDGLTPWHAAGMAAALTAAAGLYNAGHRAGQTEAALACRNAPAARHAPAPLPELREGPLMPETGGMRW